jgi:hypothetical protein
VQRRGRSLRPRRRRRGPERPGGRWSGSRPACGAPPTPVRATVLHAMPGQAWSSPVEMNASPMTKPTAPAIIATCGTRRWSLSARSGLGIVSVQRGNHEEQSEACLGPTSPCPSRRRGSPPRNSRGDRCPTSAKTSRRGEHPLRSQALSQCTRGRLSSAPCSCSLPPAQAAAISVIAPQIARAPENFFMLR